MTDTNPLTAAWIDGDPLMEAIASAVWEYCARDDEDMPRAVCDDPRTIAAWAAAVARNHAPADRAAILREAADVAARFNSDCQNCAVELEVATKLRRMAGEAQQPDTQATSATCPHCKHWYVTSEPGAHETACPMKPAAVSQPDGEA